MGEARDIFVGLDVGTTSLSAVAIDGEGRPLASTSAPNDSAVEGLPPGRAEQDPARIRERALQALSGLADRLGKRARRVRDIGLCGQQHGVLLVDERLRPLTNLITWQDRRGEEPLPGVEVTALEAFIDAAPEPAIAESGSRPGMGYAAVTLFWLQRRGHVPDDFHRALIVHDWLAAWLAGSQPCTDPTDAASTGLFNVKQGQWDGRLCAAAGVQVERLPPVRPAGTPLGSLRDRLAAATGLPAGATVHAALGDNQAGVLASLRRPKEEVLVNVGTGGQVSAVTDTYFATESLEARPFPGGRLLSVGASLCGGAAFAGLGEHYRRAIRAVTGRRVPVQEVLDALVEQAEEVSAGADGLRLEPYFLGSRAEPERTGRLSGMTLQNNTPGHWARAWIGGIVEELAGYYRRMTEAGLRPRERAVGSGNGMRRNPVMRAAAAEALGMPVCVPAWEEVAACGAALAAMVGSGACESFRRAARLVRHRRPDEG
ncbi:MAG: sedoheptulokinase [Planctomycetota bacterium]